jgi:hypothetical protein
VIALECHFIVVDLSKRRYIEQLAGRKVKNFFFDSFIAFVVSQGKPVKVIRDEE